MKSDKKEIIKLINKYISAFDKDLEDMGYDKDEMSYNYSKEELMSLYAKNEFKLLKKDINKLIKEEKKK